VEAEVEEVEESLTTSSCAFLRFRTSASNLPSPKPKSVFEPEFSLGFSFLFELDRLEAVADEDKAVREVEVEVDFERLVGAGAAVEAKKVEVVGGRPHDLRAGERDAFCIWDV
jgi:hypothetical protein